MVWFSYFKINRNCFISYTWKITRASNNPQILLRRQKFLIFSDDISWCKNNFKEDKIFFAENNLQIEDLFLMSKCHHNIISNSSYSWWGSFFNYNLDKIVIAPYRWFKEEYKKDNSTV
ncbi:MAG: hypothetical protein D8M57_20025 [Candidatus Scalindua sp. AMX11]|nr:hypothetical protein [Planctomycetota bacterium]RZV60460.1 MAG: hypothetical protein EX341_19240 [Candidatus Scalindua sp. SCAELEC01]TDE63107.1 MAG: hypothetical protein D8M57_20025 [Candidatus Scalindua sp. AMX11]